MPFKKISNLRKCSMKNCKSTNKTHSIFRFPKNENLRKKWIKVISYSNPEFAEIEDSQIMQLGVCNDHFMSDQFDDCGKRKKNAYPNKITQQEVIVGVPIISYDSDSDRETANPKIRKTSSSASVKRENQDFEGHICRFCLATDVKMFSLNMEPFNQYYQFIEPCIDELEILSNNNFPTTICYLCANSLKKCYEFGKMCSQSQSVLMEFHLIYSKINTKDITNYDKSQLQHRHNLNKFTLPSIYVEESKETQHPAIVITKQNKNPKNLRKVEASEVVSNIANKGYFKTDKPVRNVYETVIEDDKMSAEYLEPEILDNELDLEDESLDDINLPRKLSPVTHGVTIDESTLLIYGHSDLSMFGTLSFDEALPSEPISSRDDIRRTKDNVTLSTTETEEIDILPATKREAYTRSAPLDNMPSTSSSPTGNKPAKDDVLFVDVRNVNQGSPAKATPIISQSQINILKKSVFKSHGEVEVKDIFYQGDDIHVVMVNAERKQVQLMLSRTDNLKQAESKPKPPKSDVVFNGNCWHVRHLTEESQRLLIHNRKRTQSYLQAPYKCSMCFRWFQTVASYNTHINLHDPNSGSHLCMVCKLHFKDEVTLQKHLRTHTKQYSCKMCPAVFYTKTAAKEHQNTHTVFQCPVCAKQFRFPRDFENHASKHKREESYNSDSSTSGLKPHIIYDMDRKNQPTLPKRWSMTCCDITFVHKSTYNRHLALKHPEKNYPLNKEGVICELCGLLVQTQKSLVNHLESHYSVKGRSFQCHHCDKAFRTKPLLQRHLFVHTKLKQFMCSICCKEFKKESSLKEHFLKCNSKMKGTNAEMPYSCTVCGRKFYKNCTLQAHILSAHRGIKHDKQKEFNKHQASFIEFED